jgi:hypothetical protein
MDSYNTLVRDTNQTNVYANGMLTHGYIVTIVFAIYDPECQQNKQALRSCRNALLRAERYTIEQC